MGRERTVAFASMILWLLASPLKATELKPGDVLSQENAQLAKDLLPPEVLKFYEAGEYRTPIVQYPAGMYHPDDGFLAATEAYRGQLTVNELGTIIDKTTKQQPASVDGYPFPDIDPQDPQAGVKVLWIHLYNF